MSKSLSRRDFLILNGFVLGSLAFKRASNARDDYELPSTMVGRITVDRKAAVYREPREHSGVVRWTREDELLNLYYEVISPDGPGYNPRWYRVWEGYIHSAYVQQTQIRFNKKLDTIPDGGQLAEVTVPFTRAYTYSKDDGWQEFYRLYYKTTHWITDIGEGPDGKPWYKLTSELTDYLTYFVTPAHFRPIPDEEIEPISPDVPTSEKRIEVELSKQNLVAYEGDVQVLSTRVSTGLGRQPVPDGWATPRGRYHIVSKTPSKHMGSVRATGDPGGYSLPGVPWTSFFIFESGVAFHGTFWHDNFGAAMSHGCVNLRSEDAKWLFRWITPIYKTPVDDPSKWDVRGRGTRVDVL
jgi:lipoprotein-anchoring transpeptidase ErfK/SrfK